MPEYKHTLVNDGRGGQILFPPFITQREMDIIRDRFVVRDDDVFIVTYPRSGTTWMEQIVHLIANNGEQGEKLLGDAVPWLETLPNRPQGYEGFLESMTGRRFFTSHLPHALMPGAGGANGRYIYVARNPKDVAVSSYHHDRSKHGYDGTWEEYFDLFVRGSVLFGSYFDHVLPWWEAASKSFNILFVRYEEMKRDLREVATRVSDFIGVRAERELIDAVIEKSRLDTMAANPKTDLHWVPQRDGVPKHYRKGIVGDWRSYFSPEQNRRFDTLYLGKMSGTGLRFDFGDGLVLP
jgi:hypothetical protein